MFVTNHLDGLGMVWYHEGRWMGVGSPRYKPRSAVMLNTCHCKLDAGSDESSCHSEQRHGQLQFW